MEETPDTLAEYGAPKLIGLEHMNSSLRASLLQDLGITKALIDDPALYTALKHSDRVEEIVMDAATSAGRRLGYKFPENTLLEMNDPHIREAVRTLLRAPFSGFEEVRDGLTQSFLEYYRDAMHEHDMPELSERAYNSQLADDILISVATFHKSEMDQLLLAVTKGKKRAFVFDDPLHDLSVADQVERAIGAFAQRYPNSRTESVPSVLSTIISHARSHGLVTDGRERGHYTAHDTWVTREQGRAEGESKSRYLN